MDGPKMNTEQPSRRSVVLFEYPALPKYEIRFYCIIMAILMFGSWSCVLWSTKVFERKLGDLPIPKRNLPIFGPRYKDESNWEWNRWCPFAISFLPYMAMHCIIFNIAEIFISQRFMPYITTIYAIFACSRLFTPWLVLVSIIQGSFIFAVGQFIRYRFAVWISSLPLLYVVMHNTLEFYHDPFVVLIFVSYTLLSYTSFNLEAVDGNLRPEDDTLWKKYSRMLFYTFYLPYVISLVVVYPDFERQIRERATRKREWPRVIFFCVRTAFYWIAVELLLYLFYFEAMLNDPIFVQEMSKVHFFTACASLGQFFHLKYVVIFGVPAAFARIDNMQPLDGPICLAHVVLFSKVWRYFDRGLYAFFKKYIFIAICAPTFSLSRKVFAVLLCYGFVLVWHGFHYHNYIWIGLSITELFVEYTGKGIYANESVRKWREANMGDVPFRRLIACLQVFALIPSVYGNCFFVCGPFVAYTFIQRIWIEETITLRYPLFVLLTLGYVYAQVSIEVDRQYALCRKSTEKALKKDAENNSKQNEEQMKKVN